MKSDQCEKCQDRTATVYLTLIGPSDEVDTHRYCDPCYGLLQEEAANTPVENTAPAVTSSAVTNGIIAAEKPNSAADAAEASQQGPSTQCNRCSTVVLNEDLDKNFRVCPHCQFHFRIGASDRIHLLTAPGSFEELDADMMSAEVLHFVGTEGYASRLAHNQNASRLTDAIVTGIGKIGDYRVCLGALDFGFLDGSMGSVMGERLARLIETSTREGLPLIIVSTSGGLRVHEGTVSLMQMAKTCGALALHDQAKLPYISVLTDPTMAGVLASFGSIGGLILAEPAAMIGFAGPDVIQARTKSHLPEGFQTAESLLKHGLIDAIVSRPDLKKRLSEYLDYMTVGNRPSDALV